jgi:V/A-type H+-transporting ATPase subunit E
MEYGKVDKLKAKIISDAEAGARKITEEAEAQAGTIRAEAEAEVEKIGAEVQARAGSEAKEHIRRQVSLRELEAKKAILAEKGRIMEEVFGKALEELRRRDREGGYGLTKELMLRAIETGDEEIIVAPDDRKGMTPSFIGSINDELRKAGKRAEIKLADDTRQIRGGFILRRGRVESNSSFETLLTMLRDDVETEVAGILFGKRDETA